MTAKVYDAFFRRVMPRALAVAMRLLGDRAPAEDAAVEAMGRTFADWAIVGGLKHRDAWALRVTTNIAYDELRRAERTHRLTPRELLPLTDDGTESVALRLTFVPALRKLSARRRETIVLLYVAGLTRDEVAQLLGCSPESVKTYRTRGLARLRSALGVQLTPGMEDENE